MKSNKIMVTGVAGFIGFHFANRMLQSGYHVAGFDNLNDYYSVELKNARLKILENNPEFHFEKGDLSDAEFVNRFIDETAPDIIINLAAQAGVRYSIDHPRSYIDSNIVGFFNLIEAIRYYPVKHFVFASSSSVYGNRTDAPFSVEDMVDKPISLYAATKKSNELLAYTYSHLYGIPATGLRFFTVYGPWGRPDMAYFKFADSIMKGDPIKVYNNGDMLRDFTYIDDVTDGLGRIMLCPPCKDGNGDRYKIYNLGGNHPVKLMDFITTLETALGMKVKKEYLPMQPGDVYMTCADTSEIVKEFGFRPKIQIGDGLVRFAQWYKQYCAEIKRGSP